MRPSSSRRGTIPPPLPEVKVDEDDESSDDSSDERYKTLDPDYYDDKRWKASEWAESEPEDSDPEADEEMCPPITADEIAALRMYDEDEDIRDNEEVQERLKKTGEKLSSGPSLAKDEDVDMADDGDNSASSDDEDMDVDEDDDD
jgi:hypothetical protein